MNNLQEKETVSSGCLVAVVFFSKTPVFALFFGGGPLPTRDAAPTDGLAAAWRAVHQLLVVSSCNIVAASRLLTRAAAAAVVVVVRLRRDRGGLWSS